MWTLITETEQKKKILIPFFSTLLPQNLSKDYTKLSLIELAFNQFTLIIFNFIFKSEAILFTDTKKSLKDEVIIFFSYFKCS